MELKQRVQTIHEQKKISYREIGKAIGLNVKQSKYVISRFMSNSGTLYPETKEKLIDYLERQGY